MRTPPPATGPDEQQRLDGLLESLLEVVAGNYGIRLSNGAEGPWAGVLAAVDMLVEELEIGRRDLGRSERRFRAVLESAAPVALAQPDGELRLANRAFAALLAASEDSLVGRRMPELIHPEDRARASSAIEQADAHPGAHAAVELRLLRGDGRVAWARVRSTLVAGPDRRPVFRVISLLDMTARRRAEQALAQSEARFRAVVDAAGDAIFLHDLEGRLFEVNDTACVQLGFSRDELLARRLWDVQSTQFDPRPAWGRAAEQGATITLSANYLTRDGGSLPMEVKLRACDFGDRRLLLSIARDVSARLRAERQREQFVAGLVQGQEEERGRVARELHDALGQRLTGLSVQLRTLEEAAEEGREREQLRALRAQAEVAIGEVASLARRLRPPALDDLGFVESMHEAADEFRRSHGVGCDVHVRGLAESDRLPPLVETALYRILQEALTNVAKHARASAVSILIDRRRDGVQMIVEDDGRGFPVDEATNLARSRRGLGLTNIRERAGQLGGRAEFESRPGAGTAIYVNIPIEAQGPEGEHE